MIVLRLFLLMSLAVILCGGPPWAAETLPGPVRATVISVIDGDTVVVWADIWLGQKIRTRVRIAGIDAPELRAKCAREQALAEAARDKLVALINDGPVTLSEVHYGKYAGRVVARVAAASGGDVAAALIVAGLARAYDGGGRRGWCDGAEAPAQP